VSWRVGCSRPRAALWPGQRAVLGHLGSAWGAGWTRSYNGFRQFADEAARSRIYGGIHFQFDTLASMGVCTQLADYAYTNTLRPLFEEAHED
jgi:hypothetical protein